MDKGKGLTLACATVLCFGFLNATRFFVWHSAVDQSPLDYYFGKLAEILVLFTVAFIARRYRIHSIKLFWVCASAFLLFFIFGMLHTFTPTDTSAFENAASICSGVALACLLLLLAQVLCMFPLRIAAVLAPLVIACTNALFLLFQPKEPTFFSPLFIPLTALALVILFFVLRRLFPVDDSKNHLTPYKERLPVFSLNTAHLLALFGGAFIFPFLYGLMSQILESLNIHAGLFDFSSEIMGIVALVVLAVSSPLWRSPLNSERLAIAMLFIFATALSLFPLIWEAGQFISGFLLRCGYLVYYALLWVCIVKLVPQSPKKALIYMGIAIGIHHLALYGGRLSVDVLSQTLILSKDVIFGSSLFALWALVVMMLAWILVGRKAKDAAPPATETASEIDFSKACFTFEKRYGLSKREADILKEFAYGRSSPYIAGKFHISPETVKYHLKRIYSKSDCHNRQDLLDKLESIQ